MSPIRRSSSFWHNLKFMGLMTIVSAVVALGIAVTTQGLDGMMHKVSLAYKALENPTALSSEEKSEIKKIIKDKGSAKSQFDKMTADQKTRAKEQFNKLDEEEKKRLKQMFGR